MLFRRSILFSLLTLLLGIEAVAQSPPASDPWATLRRLEGRWQGAASGEPGQGTSTREYSFILSNTYLQGQNTAFYPPQPKNPKGETHSDMAVYSYDKAAKALILRQFNVEGFVNTFTQAATSNADEVRFVSTAIENIPPGFRARETYRFSGADEVTEIFEIAEPGKDFAVYSETKLMRLK